MAFAAQALYARVSDETKTRRIEALMDYIHEFILKVSCHRISEVATQKAGGDLVMSRPHANPGELDAMLIDEKFAINYMNRNLDTYSFELSSANNRDKHGWFLSPESKTTHYELVWPKSNNDGQTIESATVAIVSKEAINKWLADRGIDPQKALEQMRACVAKDDSVNHYPDCHYSKNVRDDGTVRHSMIINGVKVVQSVNNHENPINILIPKKALCEMAELTTEFKGPIHIEQARQKVEEARAAQYSIDKFMSAKDWENFEDYHELPEKVLWMRDGKAIPREDAANIQLKDGDRLCIETKEGKPVCLAVYGARKGEWGITGLERPKNIGPDQCFSIPKRMKDSLATGGIPFGFVASNATFSKQLSLAEFASPKHGDSLTTFGDYTQNQVVHLRYNAYANTFVLNENKLISPETLPAYRGIRVVSERENDLQRAVMDRFVNCIADIRRKNTLDFETLYKQIEYVAQNPHFMISTRMHRASAEDFVLQSLLSPNATPEQRAERDKLFECFPSPSNPIAVQQFAYSMTRALVELDKDARSDPDRLAALLYNEDRRTLARESHIQDYDARLGKALDVDWVARAEGYPTQSTWRGGPPTVSWTAQSIQQMIGTLNNTSGEQNNLVLSGPVPAWAMAAIASNMDEPVYIRQEDFLTKETTTVRIEAAPKANITYSQGLTFSVDRDDKTNTATINWSIDPNTKITPENMRFLQVPAIPECENVVLQSKGPAPAFITAVLAKSYSDTASNIFCTRFSPKHNEQFQGGTCLVSQNKDTIGRMANIQDLYTPIQEQNRTRQQSNTVKYDMRSAEIQNAEARQKQNAYPHRAEAEHVLALV